MGDTPQDSGGAGQIDADHDGVPLEDDCDDTDATLNLDDVDGDGSSTCDGDCDDSQVDIHPGANEVCDGIDNDCDDLIDDDDDSLDLASASVWFHDGDNDGYGDPDDVVSACLQPAQYVDNDGDCDDTDPTLFSCVFNIGNDVEFSGFSNHSANYLLGALVTVPSVVDLLAFGIIGKATGPRVKMALYTSSGGLPVDLVASSVSVPLPVGVLEIATAATVLAPGDYWLMAVFDADASVGVDEHSTSNIAYQAFVFSGSLPDPFGKPLTYSGKQFNYYIVVE
jgi:hypothetical protein